jgi:uncharacterized protein (TIGR04255 family)
MTAKTELLHLNLPKVSPANYARNFISQVVCELRFPVLFDLDRDKPPASFVGQLRKSYPVYEPHQEVKMGMDGRNTHSAVHIFRGRNAWSITLRPSSLVLETSKYESFEKFSEQVEMLIRIATPIIDSDFFTRVGLRYTNVLPSGSDPIEGWVNPDLVRPLASGLFGRPRECSGRVGGSTPDGGFLFAYGLGESPQGSPVYVLDFDLYKEDVQVDETMSLLQRLHEYEYSMFAWAIGDKAREHLGPSRK